MLTAY